MTVDVMDMVDVGQLPDEGAIPAPPASEPDEEAPYGRKADGSARRKPGPAAGAGRTMPPPRARRRTTTNRRGGGSSTSTPPRASSSAPDPTLVAGAEALLGFPAQLAALAGVGLRVSAARYPEVDGRQHPRAVQLQRHGVALTADAAAIMMHGTAIAEGVAELAPDIPGAVGVLMAAAAWGSKSKLLTAVAGLIMQGLVNHGVMSPHPIMGTIDPETLIAQTMGGGPAQ